MATLKEEECKQECMSFQIEIELRKNFQITERWKFQGKWGIQIKLTFPKQ